MQFTGKVNKTVVEKLSVNPDKFKKKPLGRPPLPIEVSRTERVVTFLTKDEREILEQLSIANNKSISATCHDLLCLALGPRGALSKRAAKLWLEAGNTEQKDET